jgi:hypothetical protein
MKPAAIAAAYSDWKLVKTRGVVQIVLEIPLHDTAHALDVLGGMPDVSKERWFAIAALKDQKGVAQQPSDAKPQPVLDKPQAGAKRDWREMPPSQQAALRCNSVMFTAFLKEERADDWHEAGADPAECVRLICSVASRSLLNTEHRARVVWKQLDDQFQAWERVGA